MGRKRPNLKFEPLHFSGNVDEDDNYRDTLAAFGDAKRKAKIEINKNLFLALTKKARKKKLKRLNKINKINNLKNGNTVNDCAPELNILNGGQVKELVCNDDKSIQSRNGSQEIKITNGQNTSIILNGHSQKRNMNAIKQVNGHQPKKKNKGMTSNEFPRPIEEIEIVNGHSKELDNPSTQKSNGISNGFTNGHSKKFSNTNGMNNHKTHFNGSKQQEIKLDRQTIKQQRQNLPIFFQRDEILDAMSQTETLIIVGETGSGKTTQLPQYIHEEKLDLEGAICITQPRRVAAITIAKRVADEVGCVIGTMVGYSVRFEEACSKNTKLKFVTDGMLLREALSDPLLSKYKWIILDEAHERSVNTDTLFGIVKSAQRRRKLKKKRPLHIIIMSATMDVDHFHSYFDNSMVRFVEGREHKIDILAMKEKTSDYIIACMQTITKIQKEAKAQEDILVFLTGQEEIEYSMKYLERMAQQEEEFPEYPNLRVYPLYASLPYYKQLQVFSKTPPDTRKIIFSTNIAETSVTIPGIKYVIDCGRVKIRRYNAVSGYDDLKVCKISQAQAWQRTGRAGREGPGVCYRTYTEEEFQAMDIQSIPEILRSNLTSVTLRLMAIGIKDVVNFDFIDKPRRENLVKAIECLKGLKAIECINGINELTDLGRKMAYFPLEPQFAKLLINGPAYSCTEEMLTIVALLSSESVYVNPNDKRDEVHERRLKFRAVEGDHIELLNVFKAFAQSTNKKIWCRKNFLNFRNLSYAENVRRQLSEICVKNHIPLLSANGKVEQVLRCLVSGLYRNVAERDFENPKVSNYKVLSSNEDARVHPGSRMFGINPDYVIFTELVKTQKTYMHIVTEVRPEFLLEFDEAYFRSKRIKKTTSVKPQYVL